MWSLVNTYHNRAEQFFDEYRTHCKEAWLANVSAYRSLSADQPVVTDAYASTTRNPTLTVFSNPNPKPRFSPHLHKPYAVRKRKLSYSKMTANSKDVSDFRFWSPVASRSHQPALHWRYIPSGGLPIIKTRLLALGLLFLRRWRGSV